MTTIHIVPHTHWDREWYETFQIFRIRLVHLIDRLLGILAEDPDYRHFTLDGQSIILDDYLAIRPQRRAELVEHVRSGRLLIGPWYILPDEFLVSPEALVRNLLYGSRVCSSFGGRMPIGYIPDPFGHIGQMPQILSGFQLEAACLQRGLDDQPCELWWESPDGTRVLLANLREGYGNAASLPVTQPAFDDFVEQRSQALRPHAQSNHLLLLNGTDHHEAQPELSRLIEGTRIRDELRHSSLPAYFDGVSHDLEAGRLDLTVVRGELRSSKRHPVLPGVLSSRTWIKQRNQACETMLESWAEPFSVLAEAFSPHGPGRPIWTGLQTAPRLERPADLLAEAWRLLLECQPHDSICGCSIDQVHAEMRPRFDQVEQIGEEITRQSLEALAGSVDTLTAFGDTARAALVVFNASGIAQSGLARIVFELPPGLDPFEIRDADGSLVPYRLLSRQSRELADMTVDREGLVGMQAMVENGRVLGLAIQAVAVIPQDDQATLEVIVSETSEPNPSALSSAIGELERWSQDRKNPSYRLRAHFATQVQFEVLARDVPPRGYRTYALYPAPAPPKDADESNGHSIQNRWLRADVDAQGRLTLNDLQRGTVFRDLIRFVDVADRGDTYNFCPVDGDIPIDRPAQTINWRRLEDDCEQSLTWTQVYRVPRRLSDDRSRRSEEIIDLPISIRLRLSPDARHLQIAIEVVNNAEDHRLQAVFRIPGPVTGGLYGGSFDVIRRHAGAPAGGAEWIEVPALEQPMRHFVAAGNDAGQLIIAARGLAEASVSSTGEVAVTLLRCVGWLSRDDLTTRKGAAGPEMATPGAQCPGRQRFELCVIPDEGTPAHQAQLASAFQTTLRGAGTDIHRGDLPQTAGFIHVEPAALYLTTIKAAEDGQGMIVRGVLLDDHPARARVQFQGMIREAARARLDESVLEPLAIRDENTLDFSVRPREIITLRVKLVGFPTGTS